VTQRKQNWITSQKSSRSRLPEKTVFFPVDEPVLIPTPSHHHATVAEAAPEVDEPVLIPTPSHPGFRFRFPVLALQILDFTAGTLEDASESK